MSDRTKRISQMNFLENQALIVKLKIGGPRGSAPDSEVAEKIIHDHGAGEGVASFSKRILPKEMWSEMTPITYGMRSFFYQHTVAWGEDGGRLLAIGNFDWFRTRMEEMTLQFEDAKARMINDYSYWCQQAEKNLGTLYRPEDYQSLEQFKLSMYVNIEYEPVPTSNHLVVKLGQAQLSQVKKKLDQKNNERLRLASNDLYTRITAAIRTVADRLDPEKFDRGIRQSIIDDLSNIAELVPTLNVMGDDNLSKLCEEVRELIDGVSANELRPKDASNFNKDKSDDLREQLDEMSEKFGGMYG